MVNDSKFLDVIATVEALREEHGSVRDALCVFGFSHEQLDALSGLAAEVADDTTSLEVGLLIGTQIGRHGT